MVEETIKITSKALVDCVFFDSESLDSRANYKPSSHRPAAYFCTACKLRMVFHLIGAKF